MGVFVSLTTPDVDVFRGELSRIIVASAIDGLLVPAPEIVVCPCNVIPFVITKHEDQLNIPAGSMIVSPSTA